jgi:hypothetical protein
MVFFAVLGVYCGEKTKPIKANFLILRTSNLDDTYAISQCKVAINAT